VIKSWIIPPIVIPITITVSLVVYVSVRAFL